MNQKNPKPSNNSVSKKPKERIQVKEAHSSTEKLHKAKFEQLLDDAVLGIKKQ